MKFAIYCRYIKHDSVQYINELINILLREDIEFLLHESMSSQKLFSQIQIPREVLFFDSENDLINQNIDFIISVGGDGTILDTLTLVKHTQIPIAGINTGRLGFLTTISKNEIEQLIQHLKQNTYSIHKRSVLYLESNQPLFHENNFAINDFTITKRDTSAMIKVHTYLNGEYLNTYWADGLIVSTPTGSTGYSLSCGGPIVFPNSDSFILTPVAPHNLNVRPVIVSDSSILSFQVEGRAKTFLCTLDSRFEVIDNTFEIAIRKAPFTFNLVRLNDNNFLTAIREKLAWGSDARN